MVSSLCSCGKLPHVQPIASSLCAVLAATLSITSLRSFTLNPTHQFSNSMSLRSAHKKTAPFGLECVRAAVCGGNAEMQRTRTSGLSRQRHSLQRRDGGTQATVALSEGEPGYPPQTEQAKMICENQNTKQALSARRELI